MWYWYVSKIDWFNMTIVEQHEYMIQLMINRLKWFDTMYCINHYGIWCSSLSSSFSQSSLHWSWWREWVTRFQSKPLARGLNTLTPEVNDPRVIVKRLDTENHLWRLEDKLNIATVNNVDSMMDLESFNLLINH